MSTVKDWCRKFTRHGGSWSALPQLSVEQKEARPFGKPTTEFQREDPLETLKSLCIIILCHLYRQGTVLINGSHSSPFFPFLVLGLGGHPCHRDHLVSSGNLSHDWLDRQRPGPSRCIGSLTTAPRSQSRFVAATWLQV